ncbi:MAG: CDP-alcohol phosphatidyltransferase family protein [Alphaproteobacteria bacterium]|nr:CDP-alcohol phosphatidyltransferase family protein [Alphaproteobacteria bacterium]
MAGRDDSVGALVAGGIALALLAGAGGAALARLGWPDDPGAAVGAALTAGQLQLVVHLLAVVGHRRMGGQAGGARPGERFGWANWITMARAAVACAIAAQLSLAGPALAAPALWAMAAALTAALALDGVDGWVARRTGTASAFGARFDMEIDAATLLVVSALAWQLGVAGAWVLAIGLMRYAFVVAGGAWAALRAPLPESARRKAVCVVQGAALVAALVPALPLALRQGGLALALALLAWSFAVDVLWLARRRG